MKGLLSRLLQHTLKHLLIIVSGRFTEPMPSVVHKSVARSVQTFHGAVCFCQTSEHLQPPCSSYRASFQKEIHLWDVVVALALNQDCVYTLGSLDTRFTHSAHALTVHTTHFN